mmetsp:Transcript_81020/g.228275  ORF Transcript_81020/g.228275 Transcript_81020/m.228275 type:complete len:224 (+) Transcript_81020:1079-1750(+)
MRFLDLVEQDQRVGPAANGLCQGAAVAVAHVARGCADEFGDRVLLHVLAHVQADHRALAAEERRGEGLAQLRLAHARRAAEHEARDGPDGVPEARAGAAQGPGDGEHCLVLADNASVELLLQLHEAGGLRGPDLLHGDARPARDDRSHVLFGDHPVQECSGAVALTAADLRDALHDLGLAGLQLMRLAEALGTDGLQDLGLERPQLLHQVLGLRASATRLLLQ